MRLHFVASALGVGVVAVAVGCGGHSTTPAAPTAPPPTVAPTFPSNRIDSLVLAPDVIGDIVGTKFNWASHPPPGWTLPPPPYVIDEGNPECDALMGPDTNTVGVVYTAWRHNIYKEDNDTFDHAVEQVVATAADSKTAAQLLDNAFIKPLDSCNNAIVHRPKDDKFRWRFQKADATDTDVRWTSTELQDGQVVGWVCANEARAKNNVVIFVQVCQNGNGAPTAATILNKISEKIPG